VFVLIARYNRPADVVDQHLDEHIAWIRRHAEAGRVLVTARQNPVVGGLIIATGDRAEIDEMISEDPFVVAGVSQYEVLEYDVRRTAPGLERLVEA